MQAGFVSGHRPTGLGGYSSLRCGVRRPLRRPAGPARGLLSLRSAGSPYDFARLMQGATEVKCSAFGDAMIRHMG